MAKLQAIFVILSFVNMQNCDSAPYVSLNQGEVLGRYFKTRQGRLISGFSGIPYAQPPIGELRFKSSLPPKKWNGTLNATYPHAVCPQYNYYDKNNPIIGDEGCLYLNVYTPQLPVTKSYRTPFPVLFYIHGGSFSIGSARYDWLGPELLLDKDVVLVTINYRLGALGFLTTGDDVIPGNNGLKDQVLALKWVKENIASFGGDPLKVTIFGNSAGASSVHHLTLSPMSKGLVHNAIIQSGVATTPVCITARNESITYAYQFGEKLNCTVNSSEELHKCLLDIDVYDIVRGQLKFATLDPSFTPFLPTIEEDGPNAFLSRCLVELIQSNKVADIPIMIGIVPYEGIIVSAALTKDQLRQMEIQFDGVVMNHFHLKSVDLPKKVREFYFGNQTVGYETRLQITDMYTDGWFLSGADHLTRNHLVYRTKPLYFYLFDYKGSASYASLYNDTSFINGPIHTDELFYLLPRPVGFPNYAPTPMDDAMTDVMTDLWSNFAKYGNPTPKDTPNVSLWKPVQSDSLEYYHIKGPQAVSMNTNLLASRVNFWRDITLKADRCE